MTKLDQTIHALFQRVSIQPNIVTHIFKEQIKDTKDISDYINLSDIFSTLIQETGRFAEHYASDLIISIDSFRKEAVALLNSRPQTPVVCNAYFGIRQSGVDCESFLNIRLTKAAEHNDYFKFQNQYRRIYAIHMNIVPEDDGYAVSVHLLNLTNDCNLKTFAAKEDIS